MDTDRTFSYGPPPRQYHHSSTTSSQATDSPSASQSSFTSTSSASTRSSASSWTSASSQDCPSVSQASVAGVQIPVDQRRHPRRSASAAPKPPTLVRQDERKVSFVDSLVDSATQMVEVIWPLSAEPPSCRTNASGVLPLRRYIEETLRRSRTSYSTLQVALYYLVLIKPHVPKGDFTRQQVTDLPSHRALQCGRRMFLAALILASKYLQDRNYSAKAWSKMSSLKVSEINMNEMAFLDAVKWKLHIPDHIFKRWTDVVLRYTPSHGPRPPAQSFSVEEQRASWKSVIPMLTPELDDVALPEPHHIRLASEQAPVITRTSFTLPSYLEPQPSVVPPLPAFAGTVSYLPTPRLTPPLRANTPAAGAVSMDAWPQLCTVGSSRRPSIVSNGSSSGASPESLLSCASSRSSRSSSISSVSTSATSVASNHACLAKLAACRNAELSAACSVSSSMPSYSKRSAAGAFVPETFVINEEADWVASPVSIYSQDNVLPAEDARPCTASRVQQQQQQQQQEQKQNSYMALLQQAVEAELAAPQPQGESTAVVAAAKEPAGVAYYSGSMEQEIKKLLNTPSQMTCSNNNNNNNMNKRKRARSVSYGGSARKQRCLERSVGEAVLAH